ncbi:MAG: hypothetical protein ACLFUQ_06840, partial [Candidatus Izemoplasmataceae bacterium]
LEDDYGLIYIRTSDRAYEYTDVFMDYIGETVRVDILLPMKTVRDEYILVDSPGGYQDIEAPYMTEQELIDATIARLEAMSPISIQSGDFIGAFPPWYSYYDVHIDYEVADPIDALYIDTDNLVANTVNEATDVVVKATVTPYGSVISGTAYLTYRIHPKETVPIKDVLFGRPDRIYQVEGIVIAASGLDQDEPWMIVEDESGRIYVDLSTADYTLFDVDDITYEVGDEVRIIARMGHFDYDGIIPNLTNVRVVDVRSSDNTFTHEPITMTFEDILELDYLYPEMFYQYIEITADLNLRYNRYELNDDDYYSDDYYGIMHYPLGLKGQDSTFSATMGDLTGETITVRGYLIGFEYMNADFDWYMAYVSHDTVPVS